MPFAVIANWDGSFAVSRYNIVATEADAIQLVDRLKGLDPPQSRIDEMQALIETSGMSLGRRAWAAREQVALPAGKLAPNAYQVEMPPPPPGTALFQHRARFWTAQPGTSDMVFDTAKCHAWQSAIHKRVIDREADRRIDQAWSPGDPNRAGRRMGELPPGAERAALEARTTTLRTNATTLKDSLAALTPEGVLSIDVSDNAHWSE